MTSRRYASAGQLRCVLVRRSRYSAGLLRLDRASRRGRVENAVSEAGVAPVQCPVSAPWCVWAPRALTAHVQIPAAVCRCRQSFVSFSLVIL